MGENNWSVIGETLYKIKKEELMKESIKNDPRIEVIEKHFVEIENSWKAKRQVHTITRVLDIAIPVLFVVSVILFASIFI